MPPGKLETILPMTLATSLIDGDGHANNSVQTLCKPAAFPLVAVVSLLLNLIQTPELNREDLGGYENRLLRMYNQL